MQLLISCPTLSKAGAEGAYVRSTVVEAHLGSRTRQKIPVSTIDNDDNCKFGIKYKTRSFDLALIERVVKKQHQHF